jgi:hypothetical protein
MPTPRRFWPRLLRAGMARATEGVMAKASLVIGALTAVGALALAVGAVRHGADPSTTAPFAAALQAWGAGVLLCFGASIRAFERDEEDGWSALVKRHGFGSTAYLGARVAGMAAWTLLIVAGGALLVGLVTLGGAHDAASAGHALTALVAALAYSATFSVAVAAVSVATLAPRARGSGYLFLLLVLVLPALVSDWTGQLVPAAWSDLVSVPGALDALRDSLHPSLDGARAVRAAAVLAAVTVGALAWARAQLALRARGRAA